MSRKKKTQPATLPNPLDKELRVRPGSFSPVANPDADAWEYDHRSNMGPQFGAQGTLFSVSKTPRSRVGPKGFSPARQDYVRAATAHSIYADSLAMKDKGWLESMPGDAGRLTPESAGRRKKAERQVQDVISQSTAPLPSRLEVQVLQPDSDELKSGWTDGYAAGNYMNRGKPRANASLATFEGPEYRNSKHRLQSHTLIHELGHAWSEATGRESSEYDTPEKQGVEEAYADDFANTHAPRSDKHYPNYSGHYPAAGRGEGFRESYDTARTTPFTHQEAWTRADSNPNLPGGGQKFPGMVPDENGETELGRAERAYREANPALPGMEDARPFQSKTRSAWLGRDGSKRPPHWEGLREYEDRVLNRQTEGIKATLAGR